MLRSHDPTQPRFVEHRYTYAQARGKKAKTVFESVIEIARLIDRGLISCYKEVVDQIVVSPHLPNRNLAMMIDS